MGTSVKLLFSLCALVAWVSASDAMSPTWTRARLDNGTGIPVGSLDIGVNLSKSERLVNGNRSQSIREFPYLVGIFKKQKGPDFFICTGSIVHERVVLTAAHCLSRLVADAAYLVCYGTDDLSDPTHRKCTRVVGRRVHKSFVAGEVDGPFDVALLKTQDPMRSGRTEIVTVDFTTRSSRGKRTGLMAGFGVKPNGWDGRLRYLKAKHKPMQQCSVFPDAKYFQCVRSRGTNGLGGTCFGDSGSPLIEGPKEKPEKHRVVGVLSWAFVGPFDVDCSELASGYSRLSIPSHKNFLKRSMREFGAKFKTV
uniref:Peptidase S1 domain-containing protein n=1 Tax=Rhodosorus marinus TaxID=101924 RepID=A0A7S2ZQJ2_9RHOD|mmetsp:Transcript_28474/g.111575  ORF Transcript_28474/g.111575 Transcript_28474/m.111575 type:complete len:308 (+) Transcript_28474:317-1240(+)|eukprot:CAMPEP_0113960296 /NCGR_PEP_ID=MMETSP0011_2-20120614/4632_1 /TAXON_ID=101924 /ORGANISM="Rhodosorus marinus" /LENGTH=307 /DNA_ID=CAMNT_0000971725 /DNA_START=277 /DNA_END=1200 /DNA_ORIENTATION=- /assembly_acc=CAM_ASM_000156